MATRPHSVRYFVNAAKNVMCAIDSHDPGEGWREISHDEARALSSSETAFVLAEDTAMIAADIKSAAVEQDVLNLLERMLARVVSAESRIASAETELSHVGAVVRAVESVAKSGS